MDRSISDWVQNLGNIIMWGEESFGGFWVKSNLKNYTIHQPPHFRTNFVRTWIVRFHGPIDFGLSPKPWDPHNIVGGVIWWVLREIQWLKLCNTPATPFQNEIRTNHNCPIWWTNRCQIESQTWGTSQCCAMSHLVSFEWNEISRTMQYTNHSFSERTSYELELSDFMDK